MAFSDTPKRRLTNLTVEEVSAVDIPANESEFAVIKNQENKMRKAAQGTVETVAVEQESQAPASEVEKALAHVNSIVSTVTSEIAKAQGRATEAEETVIAPADASSEELSKADRIRKALQDAGVEGDALEKAVTSATAEVSPAEVPPTEADPAGTLTAENLEEAVEALTKAARLTPARMAKFTAVVEAVDALKLMMEGIAVGATPKTKTPANNTVAGSGITAQMSKAAESSEALTSLVKAVEGLTLLVKSQGEQIQGITDAKPPSNSADGDATDLSKSASGDFWTGTALA